MFMSQNKIKAHKQKKENPKLVFRSLDDYGEANTQQYVPTLR